MNKKKERVLKKRLIKTRLFFVRNLCSLELTKEFSFTLYHLSQIQMFLVQIEIIHLLL